MKYPFFRIGHHQLCVYCGDMANSVDHVIPVSYQTEEDRPQGWLTNFGPVAHCCSRCNNTLSNKYFDTFQERCREASELIDCEVKSVEWTKREILGLDLSLQRFVEQKQAYRLWMRFRADWFESRDYLLNLEQLAWEPCLDKSHKKFNPLLFNYFESTLRWIKTLHEKL